MASNRAGCGRSFTAYLELAGKELLHAFVIHDQHDEVDAFNADLQSPASAAHGHKCRCAPAICCAAGCYSAAMLTAKNESTLYQMGDNGNAFCFGQNFLRNAFIRSSGNLSQNFRRLL